MVFAARLGERLGISECGLADRTESVLQSLGLPVGGVELEPTAIWELLHRDKKVRGGVRFVVCTQPGDALLTDPPDPRLVEEVMISLR
jgi:3-dehydroquinate synthase